MRKIVLASNNEKKVKELKNMLNEHNFEICSLKDENIDIDVVEDGSTFEENALKKASEIYKYLLTNIKLLDRMKSAKGEERRGRFVCALALIGNDTKEVIRGTVEGYIKEELMDGDFFGYDPLFFYPGFNKTFAEASSEEKNSVSHRGNALKELKKILIQL